PPQRPTPVPWIQRRQGDNYPSRPRTFPDGSLSIRLRARRRMRVPAQAQVPSLRLCSPREPFNKVSLLPDSCMTGTAKYLILVSDVIHGGAIEDLDAGRDAAFENPGRRLDTSSSGSRARRGA